jgi:hypothetical protein
MNNDHDVRSLGMSGPAGIRKTLAEVETPPIETLQERLTSAALLAHQAGHQETATLFSDAWLTIRRLQAEVQRIKADNEHLRERLTPSSWDDYKEPGY